MFAVEETHDQSDQKQVQKQDILKCNVESLD